MTDKKETDDHPRKYEKEIRDGRIGMVSKNGVEGDVKDEDSAYSLEKEFEIGFH